MRMRKGTVVLAVFIAAIIALAGITQAVDEAGNFFDPAAGSAVPSKMSYQGFYTENGSPVTGTRNMVFKIFTNSTCTGSPLQTMTKNNTQVADGLFTAILDVTAANFNGQGLWLRVEVNSAALGCAEIIPAPYALHSASTGALHGRPVSSAAPASSQVLSWTGSQWAPAADNSHDHLGQSWTGSLNPGLQITNTSGSSVFTRGVAMRGLNGTGAVGDLHPGGSFWPAGGEFAGSNGLIGAASNEGFDGYGVIGLAQGSAGRGVYGVASHPSGTNYGVYGESYSTNGYAGYFSGRVHVAGTLSKSAGSFKIDHPLDPENQYLSHSFVESPDMMNVYNGNVVLDANGEAWVELADWFEALNVDFRYQLTPVGGPGPNLHIARKIEKNRFKIAGGSPGLEVSWQVTGIRQDPYARENRIQVEETKPAAERGTYLYPQGYDQPASRGVVRRQGQETGNDR